MEDTNEYAAFRHLLGERVQTKDGVGVLVGVKTPCNGLYYRPEIAELMVWYPPDCGSHLSSWTYKADEVKAFESSAACDDCGGQTVLRTVDGVEERKCLDCGAVLDAVEYPSGCCPKCGWDHERGQRTEAKPVIKNASNGGRDWVELWVCEDCGTEFEFENGCD